MADRKITEGDRTEHRKRALERLRRAKGAPQAALVAEAEVFSLRSAFALADLLNALRGR